MPNTTIKSRDARNVSNNDSKGQFYGEKSERLVRKLLSSGVSGGPHKRAVSWTDYRQLLLTGDTRDFRVATVEVNSEMSGIS